MVPVHKLRRAMVRPGRDRLNGIVEVDETYVGRAEKGKWGREIESKAIVALAVEEDGKGVGRIRLRRVKDVSADSLLPFVQGAVVTGATIHRRLERLRRAQGGRLQAQGERDQRQLRSRTRGDAARAHGRLALEALAARHAAGRHPAPASRLLPRRVHLPLQPPSVTGARPALPSARRTGRRRRAGDLPRHHEKSPKSGPLSGDRSAKGIPSTAEMSSSSAMMRPERLRIFGPRSHSIQAMRSPERTSARLRALRKVGARKSGRGAVTAPTR